MRVLVCDPIAPAGIEVLSEHADVDVKTGLRPEELPQVVDGYHGLVVRSQTQVTAATIDAANHLLVIGRAGVGVDNIDVEAASQRGIVVVNAPMSVTIAAAEHTIAMMLALARRIPQAHSSILSGRWERNRYLGIEMRNKTLGILGLGHIGSEVARRAAALEMHVLAVDPFVTAEFAERLGVTLVKLDELLAQADFLTIHVPLTPGTRGLIGARELAGARRGIRIVNCARGGIIDEAALADAIRSGQVAGAALDVFANEPPRESPLLAPDVRDRVVVTPHLGASTEEAQVSAAVQVAQEVVAVLQGRPARYVVNAPAMLPETMAALRPYVQLGEKLGRLMAQLNGGPVRSVEIVYNGDIADYDTTPVRAAVVKGLLSTASPEHITIVNALLMAKNRGLQIVEQKCSEPVENFANLLTLRIQPPDRFVHSVSGTTMQGEPHVVRVNDYRVDIVPSSGYFLFCNYADRPGVVGKIGTLLGSADVNISFMQVGRREPRGEAMMVLALDEPLTEALYQRIVDEVQMKTAKVVSF